MSSLYGTAIYKKNLPTWERAARTIASIAMIVAATVWIDDLRLRWVAIAAGAMMALTGTFGFCPACYLVGRKIA